MLESGCAAGELRQNFAPVRVRVLENHGELDSLACAWGRMPLAEGVTPMQQHIWHLSCAETLLGRSRLAVVVVEGDTGIRALAPLMRSTVFPHGYEQLGVRTLHEPSNLLYTDDSALNVLLEALSRIGNPLILGRVGAHTPILAATRRAFAGRGIVVTRDGGGLPYINLEGSGGDAEPLLSSRLRSDLRRARRKADAAGRVTFEIHLPTSVRDFLSLFEEALEVEAAGWKGRLGSALATDTTRREFFRRYGSRATDRGILRLAFMRIDSKPVAMQFAIQTGGSFWLFKIGYDEAFSECSPGMLLILETLRFAEQQGLSSYEFLGRSEPWTKRWTRCETPCVRIETYPYTTRGMTAFGGKIIRTALTKASRKLRRPR